MAEALHVPVDVLGRSEGEPLLCLRVADRDAREPVEPRSPRRRIHEEILAWRRFLPHAARDFEMVSCVRPSAFNLSLDGGFLVADDDRVRGKQLEQVAAPRSGRNQGGELFGFHRKDGHTVHGLTRALRVQIEAPHRCDLIAPPFDACGRRHAESIYVENAAPDAVLCNLGDCGHPLVPHGLEALRGVR